MPGEKNNDNISPEELWKSVSQQLTFKKYESVAKTVSTGLLDLDSFAAEIQRVRDKKESKQMKSKIHSTQHSYPISKKEKTPAFFPTHSFIHFCNPNFYNKFDLDTLFFIFYYFKATVQQTYAAIRLKSYGWRYHLKYKMWFQRLDEPKVVTTEYEKGEFLFFDYETTWNFMKKDDFVFEYCYLEHGEF